MFINILKKSVWAAALSAMCDCHAVTWRSSSAAGSQTCGQTRSSMKQQSPATASTAPCQDTAHDRKAAEMVPVFMAKQTHLCPRHRCTQRYFSPSLLSGGESVFLSHSDTYWVLQPALGNCLVGLISFAGKTGSFPPCPGFTQVRAILKIKPVGSQFSWSFLHGKDVPLPSWSHRDLSQSLGWLYLGGVSSIPKHQQQSLYSTALNPDCLVSFLTLRAVFCHPAP